MLQAKPPIPVQEPRETKTFQFLSLLSSFRFLQDDIGSHTGPRLQRFWVNGATYRRFQIEVAGYPPKEVFEINLKQCEPAEADHVRTSLSFRTSEWQRKDPATADPHFRNTAARETVDTAWGQRGPASGEVQTTATPPPTPLLARHKARNKAEGTAVDLAASLRRVIRPTAGFPAGGVDYIQHSTEKLEQEGGAAPESRLIRAGAGLAVSRVGSG
ncbi:uncharacterized protein B0H64DRAFT_149608 [Chaetomium fimeti]|uniref:Uncharacterized protein n=1 Tax=Chaetomium fimeti TaxID=1854472 RepID=A0AAE0HFR3_9PEZI|nr:hypothetical protein B0H64DRAFT_149608 [Chaetomium fimeti]